VKIRGEKTTGSRRVIAW